MHSALECMERRYQIAGTSTQNNTLPPCGCEARIGTTGKLVWHVVQSLIVQRGKNVCCWTIRS
jgi:hypothetical protein